MTAESFHFDDVEAFVPGTIGPRGQRVFFLQVRDRSSSVSFKLEKQQVASLADFLASMLADLPPIDHAAVPALEQVVEPVASQWAVGEMGVDFNRESDKFVLVVEQLADSEADEDPELILDSPATLRLAIDRGQASAFITQARDLVMAGRPPCPYCGRPWEPADEFCLCYN